MAIGLIERETRVTLIEPNLKKSVFLVEVSRELGLEEYSGSHSWADTRMRLRLANLSS